jgi:hypothetical protein
VGGEPIEIRPGDRIAQLVFTGLHDRVSRLCRTSRNMAAAEQEVSDQLAPKRTSSGENLTLRAGALGLASFIYCRSTRSTRVRSIEYRDHAEAVAAIKAAAGIR